MRSQDTKLLKTQVRELAHYAVTVLREISLDLLPNPPVSAQVSDPASIAGLVEFQKEYLSFLVSRVVDQTKATYGAVDHLIRDFMQQCIPGNSPAQVSDPTQVAEARKNYLDPSFLRALLQTLVMLKPHLPRLLLPASATGQAKQQTGILSRYLVALQRILTGGYLCEQRLALHLLSQLLLFFEPSQVAFPSRPSDIALSLGSGLPSGSVAPDTTYQGAKTLMASLFHLLGDTLVQSNEQQRHHLYHSLLSSHGSPAPPQARVSAPVSPSGPSQAKVRKFKTEVYLTPELDIAKILVALQSQVIGGVNS